MQTFYKIKISVSLNQVSLELSHTYVFPGLLLGSSDIDHLPIPRGLLTASMTNIWSRWIRRVLLLFSH